MSFNLKTWRFWQKVEWWTTVSEIEDNHLRPPPPPPPHTHTTPIAEITFIFIFIFRCYILFYGPVSSFLMSFNQRPTGGGGGVWTRPKKRGRAAPPFFAQLFGQLFRNFPENFRSRSPKVRSPGQVKCPHLRKKHNNRVTATVVERNICDFQDLVYYQILNPRTAGGRLSPPPSGFSQIAKNGGA